jgi:hypothetical protein
MVERPDGETKAQILLPQGFGSDFSSIGQILKKAAPLAKMLAYSEQFGQFGRSRICPAVNFQIALQINPFPKHKREKGREQFQFFPNPWAPSAGHLGG